MMETPSSLLRGPSGKQRDVLEDLDRQFMEIVSTSETKRCKGTQAATVVATLFQTCIDVIAGFAGTDNQIVPLRRPDNQTPHWVIGSPLIYPVLLPLDTAPWTLLVRVQPGPEFEGSLTDYQLEGVCSGAFTIQQLGTSHFQGDTVFHCQFTPVHQRVCGEYGTIQWTLRGPEDINAGVSRYVVFVGFSAPTGPWHNRRPWVESLVAALDTLGGQHATTAQALLTTMSQQILTIGTYNQDGSATCGWMPEQGGTRFNLPGFLRRIRGQLQARFCCYDTAAGLVMMATQLGVPMRVRRIGESIAVNTGGLNLTPEMLEALNSGGSVDISLLEDDNQPQLLGVGRLLQGVRLIGHLQSTAHIEFPTHVCAVGPNGRIYDPCLAIGGQAVTANSLAAYLTQIAMQARRARLQQESIGDDVQSDVVPPNDWPQ